jgi:hypothetical protein
MDKSGQMGSDQQVPQQGTKTTDMQQQGQSRQDLSRRGTAPQAGQASDQPSQMGGTTQFTDWASI